MDETDHLMESVVAAQGWDELSVVIDGLPAVRLEELAERLWLRAWQFVRDAQHDEDYDTARDISLLGELIDRVAEVGVDSAVEEFLDYGALSAALDHLDELATEQRESPGYAVELERAELFQQRFVVQGDRADLDAAIEAYETATGAPEPDDRVVALIGLGSVLCRRFALGTDPVLLDRGLAAVTTAAAASGPPRRYAHNVMGNLHTERYDWFGDPADLDSAVAAYEAALAEPDLDEPDAHGFAANLAAALTSRYLRNGDPNDLAAATALTDGDPEHTFGPRLELRAVELNHGQDLAAIDETITALESAAADQPPYAPDRFIDLAALGGALHTRWQATEDPADLERARTLRRRMLTVCRPGQTDWPLRAYGIADLLLNEGDADEAIRWATTALDAIPANSPLRPAAAGLLGMAYNQRYDRTGDVEDLSHGVDQLTTAIAACPPRSRELPGLANGIANLLRRRFHRTRNLTDLDTAVDHLRRALDATDPGSVNRPDLQINLAAALTDAQQAIRVSGGTGTEHADEAIAAATSVANDVTTGHSDHATIQEVLALAWLQRAKSSGEPADFDAAVAAARAAVEFGPDGDNDAMLANALAERFDHTGAPADRDAATAAYQNALTRSDRGPELVLRDARNWGVWAARHGAWTDATEAFDHANQAATLLFRTQRGELGTAEWLGYTDGLPHWAALAHHRLGDDATAIDAFETGRAVLLRGTEPMDATFAAVPAHVVHLATTQLGGLALITAPDGSVDGIDLPHLTLTTLADRVNGMLAAHHNRNSAPVAWNRTVLDLTGWCWDAVMGPLLDALPPNARLVLIPGGGAALLPWHAATPAGSDQRSPDPAGATVTISYAPHRQALTTAQNLAAAIDQPRHLLSIIDPPHTGNVRLPDAADELAALSRHFTVHTTLSGATATTSAVLDALRADTPIDVLLAACHAEADLADPTASALLLAGEDQLAIAELRAMASHSRPLRLALLTACRSAQPGVTLPDETINLPTALLQIGCAATIGTLWAIPSRTAAAFTALFAQAWPAQDPATAARTALTALRTLDTATERELLPGLPPLSAPPTFRPHHHPSRWAPFVCTGW